MCSYGHHRRPKLIGRSRAGPVSTPRMRRDSRWVLALASAASLMVALDTLVVSTALSTIRVELDASLAALEWTVNAYNLSFAVLLMTGAALGDRFGRRRGFTAGLAIFVAGSAACALAPSVEWLIAARAVQGAGAALVMPLGMALVSSAFAPERRGQALGIYFGVTGLAVASGPVVGGAITEGLAWEWIFWINVPLGLALLPLDLAPDRASRAGRTARSTSSGWCSWGSRGSASCGGSCAGTSWAGPRPRWWPRSPRAWSARRRSWRGSGAWRTRCCRCGSSAPARSRPATRPSSSPSPRCSARCSSSPSSCRPGSATGRSTRACGCCRGR